MPARSRENPPLDPYEPQLAALRSGACHRAKTVPERAAFLIEKISEWNSEQHGDWQDAVAVAARRQKVHSRDSRVLLAKVLWAVDSKRAAEIGRIAEKLSNRSGGDTARLVSTNGGVKRVSILSTRVPPPKRPKFQRRSRKA